MSLIRDLSRQMADSVTGEGPPEPTEAAFGGKQSRKEKRKALKKLKRKQIRKEAAIRAKEEEEARLNDPEEQLRLRLREQEEAANSERVRREFEERERLWLETAAARKAREEEDEQRKKLLEEEERREKERWQCLQKEHACGLEDDDAYDYVEEGPAEIIWQGNEIIVKKKRVKVAKQSAKDAPYKEDDDRPTSNPLPPQSAAFSSHVQRQSVTAQEVVDSVPQQVPNFGTEQDKAHCPFHLKTGACRFGLLCSRAHFYPEESCTLLIKNMYNGPGLSCEQDEGLEVCKNSSYHLRGNVYVHYKSLESAILAYNTMTARYYAGKQIICEFIGVTRWKVAICGEYMKSRLKTCSHGSACNFIHCFRNPGGDYEWADWDNPPPKYWIKKMSVLFGLSWESGYEKKLESEDYWKHKDSHKDSRRTRKIRSHSSDGEKLNSRDHQYNRHSMTRKYSSRRQNSVSEDENEQLAENQRSKDHFYSKSSLPHSDEAGKGIFKEENGVSSKKNGRYVANISEDHRIQDRRRASEGRPSSRRQRNVYSVKQENPEFSDVSKSHKHIKSPPSVDRRKKHGRYVADIPEDHRIQNRRHASEDHPSNRRKRNVYSGEQENPECDNMSKCRNQTPDSAHCRERSHSRYSSGDLDSDKDSSEANSLSGKRRKYYKHSSQHQRSLPSHEHQYNAGEFRKGKSSSEMLSPDESPGRWKLSEGDYLLEESSDC